MVNISQQELLDAGVHFGHLKRKWNPKMAPYIFMERNGIHIIDLNKTVDYLQESSAALKQIAKSGKKIMFVATKKQAKEIVSDCAKKVNMPFATERWLGGMLTNAGTIQGRIKHLKDIEAKMASGELANKYNKLEIQRFQEEIDEMNRIYGGIKDMASRVGAVFIIDVVNDVNAVREAKKLGLPIVALVDTNADPTGIDFPIPCNDDAIKTIQLIIDYLKQAVEEGKNKVAKTQAPDKDEK